MNGLSSALSYCKAGCYINEQCMNHIMYADDICVMAPTAIALQKLLDVCFEYSIANDLLFNPVQSVCIVFKPCRFKLYCPTVSIRTERLTYINTVKYLGFVFCENKKDDEDMLKQMRSLYAKSNKVIRMFNHCTVDVKLLLIKSYCTSFYCGYLWSDYKAKTFSKLRVAFNNVYRRVLVLPTWSSASEMYATHNIENFEALLRKVIYGFIQRLEDSSNVIIQTLTKSWTIYALLIGSPGFQNCINKCFCCIFSSFFFFRKNYLLLSCATSVRPSVRPSVCPSVRPSVRLSVCGNNFFSR